MAFEGMRCDSGTGCYAVRVICYLLQNIGESHATKNNPDHSEHYRA